jgi:hypothetical protein
MKKSPIDDPLFGHVVVRADSRATHAMYVFRSSRRNIEEPVRRL